VKKALGFITRAFLAGLLVVVPIYLAVLLLLKGMKSVATLVRPFALLLPEWVPAETALSLLLVVAICILIGVAVVTRPGRAARDAIERSVFQKIPGYGLLRNLTEQMAGKSRENVWRPALFETDEGLLLAFIIEEFGDRYTVFVPSIPTPLAGAVYVVDKRRVHALDVPFTDAVKTVSRWGSGAKELVAAMERGGPRHTPAP
jgi:uncharacterized membrane protein